MERLIDYAAAETGFDRIELRRKNQIRKSEIPCKAASGATYDSGDFPAILKQALDASDWKGFNKRKRESKKQRQAARHRRRLLSRSHRAGQQGDGRHRASTPTAASPSSPARSTTARATPRRSRRC